jgi:hypothetical protein
VQQEGKPVQALRLRIKGEGKHPSALDRGEGVEVSLPLKQQHLQLRLATHNSVAPSPQWLPLKNALYGTCHLPYGLMIHGALMKA